MPPARARPRATLALRILLNVVPLRQNYATRNKKACNFNVLQAFNGASGETRTLTLSPETDFESAASTDSATEAMAAQYRETLCVGQSA